MFSDIFYIRNGVRQGGILSPFLFAVYIDDLSCQLQSLNVGCYIGNLIINHLLFADDAVVFAPSPKGLQQLLNVCSAFAQTHNIVFNTKKSQCLIVSSKRPPINRPAFYLNSVVLPHVESYKYLGYIINSSLTDDADIKRQMRSLYARANMLVRRFYTASVRTKCMLFNAFCTSLYGCQLWCSAFKYNFDKLQIAYNDAFRLLLNEPRWCSASRLFTVHNLPTFYALMRKLIYSFKRCLQNSSNSLLAALFNSDFQFASALFSKWRTLLYIV